MIPRLALLGALLASSLGLAHSNKFNFPTCVDDCVGSNGCGSNNAKCMCRAANNGNFLVQVVGCMSRRCDGGVNNVDGDFLDVITRGCSVARIPISGDRIQAAESAAESLRGHPSPPVQTTPKQPPATQSPGKTTAQQPSPSIIPTLSEEPPASITRRPGDEPTVAPVFTVTRTDGPIVPTTAANSPPSEPTDSSPFAVPNAASEATIAWIGAWVPLVVLWGVM